MPAALAAAQKKEELYMMVAAAPSPLSSLKHPLETILPPVTKTAASLCKGTLLPSGAPWDSYND